MSSLGLQYIGSFQDKEITFVSENPLEEVWARIAQLGSSEHIRRGFQFNNPSVDAETFIQYAVVRIRQAVEFRGAARQSTILTAPLSLYYSFLNLLRAFLILKPEVMPSPSHGLTFEVGGDLLSSSAVFRRQGTFIDYLRAEQITPPNNLRITLADVLSRIVEMRYDYQVFLNDTNGSLVAPIIVIARRHADITLHFPTWLSDFRASWQQEFPRLSDCCYLLSDGNILCVNPDIPTDSYEEVSSFCQERLDTELRIRDTATWYLVREMNPDLVMPRPAYYFVAMFILGSVVRYEPELMLEVSNPDSQLGWLIRRVVNTAERFYPQLMLMWLHDKPIYFS